MTKHGDTIEITCHTKHIIEEFSVRATFTALTNIPQNYNFEKNIGTRAFSVAVPTVQSIGNVIKCYLDFPRIKA